MYYLGIDCSLRSSGIALYSDESGYETYLIKTNSKEQEGSRLEHIFNEFNAIVKGKDIQIACMEGPSYHSVNKSFSMGAAYGIYKLACSLLNIELIILPPTKLKKYMCGKGSASKGNMVSACNAMFKLGLVSDDKADAVACCSVAREVGSSLPLNLPGTRAALEIVTDVRASQRS
jgi:Holliday junction resolvasome RuvABC endonuclease subunit